MAKRFGILLLFLWAETPFLEGSESGRLIEFEALRLRAENPFTRAQASDRLRQLADDPTNAPRLRETLRSLTHLLDDPSPIVRWNIAVAVVRVGDMPEVEDAYRVLERDARDALYSTSIGAVETLADLGTERSREILASIAESSPDEDVRDAAQAALALRSSRVDDGFDFGPDDGAPPVPEERVLSPAEQLAQARLALAHLPHSSALATLADLTRYREGFLVENERTTWSALVSPVALSLMRFLRQEPAPSPMDVRHVAKILGVGGEEVSSMLLAALDDPLPHVREAAVFALLVAVTTADGQAADSIPPGVPEAVVFSLGDASPVVRRYAATLLGKVGGTAYRPQLALLLNDSDLRVRAAAAQALLALGESAERTRAIETLRADLRDAPPEHQRYVLEALAATMTTDELRAFVRVDSPNLCYAAAALLAGREDVTLGPLIAETARDDRPWVQEAVRRIAAGRFAMDNPWMAAFVGLNALSAPQTTPPASQGLVVGGGGWSYFSETSLEMPIAGAVVQVGGEKPRLTDALGRFELPTHEGNELHIEAEGYLPLDVYRSGGEQDVPLVIRLHRD